MEKYFKIEAEIEAEKIRKLAEESGGEHPTSADYALANDTYFPDEEMMANREAKEQKKKQYVEIGVELSERTESFPFPGIRPDQYKKIKDFEEEHPSLSTPIDEIIKRLTTEGMKVVLGNHFEKGNIYILPTGSSNIEDDSILPGWLITTEDMDEQLKLLIEMNFQFYQK